MSHEKTPEFWVFLHFCPAGHITWRTPDDPKKCFRHEKNASTYCGEPLVLLEDPEMLATALLLGFDEVRRDTKLQIPRATLMAVYGEIVSALEEMLRSSGDFPQEAA